MTESSSVSLVVIVVTAGAAEQGTAVRVVVIGNLGLDIEELLVCARFAVRAVMATPTGLQIALALAALASEAVFLLVLHSSARPAQLRVAVVARHNAAATQQLVFAELAKKQAVIAKVRLTASVAPRTLVFTRPASPAQMAARLRGLPQRFKQVGLSVQTKASLAAVKAAFVAAQILVRTQALAPKLAPYRRAQATVGDIQI